jgi:hypothetical protein
MLKIPKPLSASEAAKARNPKRWRGWFPAEFLDAVVKHSQRSGNPMIEVRLAVFNNGETREYPDYFTASQRFAEKLRHALEAVGDGALERYETAGEVGPEIFPGHTCEVRLDIETRPRQPDRTVVCDYRRAAAVVNSRVAE